MRSVVYFLKISCFLLGLFCVCAQPVMADAGDKESKGCAKGTVSVSGVPWGVVRIDDKRVGSSPVVKKYCAGTHVLELRSPINKKVYIKDIEVKKGKVTVVYFDFNADKVDVSIENPQKDDPNKKKSYKSDRPGDCNISLPF